jgi:uncharacterized membrane protein YdjX (TVP38/TMEM64 family)
MSRNAKARLALLVLIACLIAIALGLLFGTERGRMLLDHHQLRHHLGEQVRDWVGRHKIVAPAIFIGVYVICSLLLLPVWWLQLLAGVGFGLVMGTTWICIAATTAAVTTMGLGHWLGGDWVHARTGDRMRRLQELSVAFEHNGLLVVLVTRLLHGIPFGLSNYLFGLMGIQRRDAALGTLVGGVPVNAFYAALGSSPRLVKSWKFWVIVIAINAALLTPLGVKWYRQRRAAKGIRMRGFEPVTTTKPADGA